jgi:hypothetical protein
MLEALPRAVSGPRDMSKVAVDSHPLSMRQAYYLALHRRLLPAECSPLAYEVHRPRADVHLDMHEALGRLFARLLLALSPRSVPAMLDLHRPAVPLREHHAHGPVLSVQGE